MNSIQISMDYVQLISRIMDSIKISMDYVVIADCYSINWLLLLVKRSSQ